MAKLVLCLFSLTWELQTGGLLRGWIFSHTPLDNVLSLEQFVSRRGLKASCESLHVIHRFRVLRSSFTDPEQRFWLSGRWS